jgi:transposase-like protein
VIHEFKAAAVEQACQPGVNMSAVARQIGILPSQLYRERDEHPTFSFVIAAARYERWLGLSEQFRAFH